jgi:hypothetical protein
MIKRAFLKKQMKKSHAEGRTTHFLRRLVFSIVDKALLEHYGPEYPLKCLQASVGVQLVLDSFGIQSRLFTGAVCFAQVYEGDETALGWGGFWDQDHHVWVVTEFRELVDLTIAKLHLHPVLSRPDAIPIPALWWDEITTWPRTILYLPEGSVTIELPEEEMADLDLFTRKVRSTKDRILNQSSFDQVSFSPILYGPKSLNTLSRKGNLWLQRTLKFQELNIPFPPWVQRRQQEIMRRYQSLT